MVYWNTIDYVVTEQTEVVWVTVRSNIARFLVSISLYSLYLNRWVCAYLDSRFGPTAVQYRSVHIIQYDTPLFADFNFRSSFWVVRCAMCSVVRNCSFMLASRSPCTFAKFEVLQNFRDKKVLSFFIQETNDRICH